MITNISLFFNNSQKYGASSSEDSFSTFSKIWLINISVKKWKELFAHITQAISDIHTVKKPAEAYIFTARLKHLTTGPEIDKEVVDGLFHAEEVGNIHFQAFFPREASG